MIGIAGFGSSIAKALVGILPPGEKAVRFTHDRLPLGCRRYLFCAGYLAGERIDHLDEDQSAQTWGVNFADVATACEGILNGDPGARICVVSSDSGYRGSFDMGYAGAKAAMNLYIERRQLHPEQQLVGVAPWIVADAGMTLRRKDPERIAQLAAAHPKERHVTALEVAKLIAFLLYEDRGFISGTVVRMHGGRP